VIEAADFNYSSGEFIDTPADGGFALYLNQVGTGGIDEQKNAARQATKSYYRPSDAVIIQPANAGTGTPPTPTEQKFVSAAANGDTNDVEVEVGYNSGGDWLNYSRTFGPSGSAPAGAYNVWCYLATSGSGVQSSFSQVTSSPTLGDQTTNFIGTFGTAAFTDNGYFNYLYVPLVNQFGDIVSLTLGNGVQTFKSTVVGNPNLAFYLFVPAAPVLKPTLQSVYPDGSVPFQQTNKLAFAVSPNNGAPIAGSGIHLTLNGVDVTAGLSLSPAGTNWIGSYSISTNVVYAAVISVTNTAGLGSSYPIAFDTFNVNNYQWEAVDYDFSTNNGSGLVGAQFIDNPVPTADVTAALTGTTATNSYFWYPTGFFPGNDPNGYGAVAQQGVDIYWTNSETGVDAYYRLDGVGSQPATDYVRPKFLAEQQALADPNVGQFNIGFYNAGNWLNYTRHFPTNTYNIWGRLAGGNGAFSGTKLSIVTSGVGTSLQTSNLLGTFADPAPVGWQTYHWIPLLDANSNKVAVSLGGRATLKVTSGNNLNPLFFMLTPAASPLSPFSISAVAANGQIEIFIPTQVGHTFTLWVASSVSSPSWTTVGTPIAGDGTVHVITQPATARQDFYRVTAQ
jgi:hypothetical protein